MRLCRQVALALVAASGIACQQRVAASGPPPLLARAHRVASTKGWMSGAAYAWRSPGQVLAFVGEPDTAKLVAIDARTGGVRPLDAFNAVFSARQYPWLDSWHLSSDGSRILAVLATGFLGGLGGWTVVSLDGRTYGHGDLPRAGALGAALVPRIFAPGASESIARDDAAGHLGLALYPIGGSGPPRRVASSAAAPPDTWWCDILGLRLDRVIVVAWPPAWGGSAWVFELPLSAQSAKPRTWRVRMPRPREWKLLEAGLSPDGEHIVWLLAREAGDHTGSHRDAGVRRRPADLWVEIWTSGTDGRKWHLVGRTQDDRVHQVFTSRARWLPTGKELSFLHGDWLYRVPVGP